MPAVPIIIAVAVDYAAVEAATFVIADIAAGTILASAAGELTLAGAAVAGAVGGAAGGAVSAAVSGGDVGKAALTGAVGGSVGGGVGNLAQGSSAIGGVAQEISDATGIAPSAAQAGVTGAIRGAVGTTATDLISGKPLGQSLKEGGIAGVAGGVASGTGSAVFGDSQGSKSDVSNIGQNLATSALKTGLQTGLTDLTGGSGQTQQSASQTAPAPSTGTTGFDLAPPTQGGSTPSVAALSQALRTVPDLGYSPGGPVFGSESTEAPKKVWNQASLRVTDEQNA